MLFMHKMDLEELDEPNEFLNCCQTTYSTLASSFLKHFLCVVMLSLQQVKMSYSNREILQNQLSIFVTRMGTLFSGITLPKSSSSIGLLDNVITHIRNQFWLPLKQIRKAEIQTWTNTQVNEMAGETMDDKHVYRIPVFLI